MESKEQKEVLTLDKIVELALKLEMTPEARQSWIDDQHKKYRHGKRRKSREKTI